LFFGFPIVDLLVGRLASIENPCGILRPANGSNTSRLARTENPDWIAGRSRVDPIGGMLVSADPANG